QHKTDPTPDILQQIKSHQQAIKKYMSKDSQKALLWTKQLFYDKSNKADSLLARTLRQKTQTKRIDKINSPKGTTYDTPDDIAYIFAKYFTKLYDHKPEARQRQQQITNQRDIESYLKDIPLPTLPDEAKTQIAALVMTEEIA
ncbi:Hypothetical predicted protein, partial [Pelobates cultripes]